MEYSIRWRLLAATGSFKVQLTTIHPGHSPRKPARLTAKPAGQPLNNLQNQLMNPGCKESVVKNMYYIIAPVKNNFAAWIAEKVFPVWIFPTSDCELRRILT